MVPLENLTDTWSRHTASRAASKDSVDVLIINVNTFKAEADSVMK